MDILKAERQRRDEKARRFRDQRLQPRRKTAQRYDVDPKTVGRWEGDPKLEFPQSVLINGRRYDDLDLLDEWDQMMAKRGRRGPATTGDDMKFESRRWLQCR